MITADQILCHMIGDYILQSDWMASNKTKSWEAAMVHAVTYCIPFAVMLWLQGYTGSVVWYALSRIMSTHYLIDRYRLARYLCWLKNFLAPRWIDTGREHRVDRWRGATLWSGFETIYARNYPWKDCKDTGYHISRPPFMSVWLMIIADNTLHVLINGLILWRAGLL